VIPCAGVIKIDLLALSKPKQCGKWLDRWYLATAEDASDSSPSVSWTVEESAPETTDIHCILHVRGIGGEYEVRESCTYSVIELHGAQSMHCMELKACSYGVLWSPGRDQPPPHVRALRRGRVLQRAAQGGRGWQQPQLGPGDCNPCQNR
jgi:hypothetical protein